MPPVDAGVARAAWLETCVLKVPPEQLNARLHDNYNAERDSTWVKHQPPPQSALDPHRAPYLGAHC